MSPSPVPFPSPEEGLRLHVRLGELDALATLDVCRAYLVPLLDYLAVRFPRVDPDLRQEAVHKALFAYLRNPPAYSPQRAELGAYLRMAVRGDLLNLLRREGRHWRKRVSWEVVEDGMESGKFCEKEEEPCVRLQRAEEEERWQAYLRRVTENFTDGERAVLELMLEGERKTAVFAQALGMGGLSVQCQEREVKRVKDRIKRRLERGGTYHD